jgi:hypothetical protein
MTPQEKISLRGRIAHIAKSAETLSIGLLSEIDETVDFLYGSIQVMAGLTKIMVSEGEKIGGLAVVESSYIDPNDTAIDFLTQTVATLKNLLPVIVRKRAAIVRSERLESHHREALGDAWQATAEAVCDLIGATDDFRRAIVRHDLAAEPRDTETFSSVEALISALRAQ